MLWIGNSFTYFNDLPGMVREIAASQGVKLSCTRFLKGGERFSGHLKNPELIRALISGHWDYIVLQEQSTAPAMPTRQVIRKVYPAARTLDSLAHVGSPDAKVIFYMTWGHKFGNRKPVAGYPLANDYENMQERLKTSYLEMAYDNDAWCAPVEWPGSGFAGSGPSANSTFPTTTIRRFRGAIWRQMSSSRRCSGCLIGRNLRPTCQPRWPSTFSKPHNRPFLIISFCSISAEPALPVSAR